MSTPCFRPRVEPLEYRLTPAGNVTAIVSRGVLVLTGDAAGNAIVVTQPAPGEFTVAGEGGTTVNGGTAPVTLRGVRDVRAGMGGGDDSVRLGGPDGDALAVGRDLLIDGGTGTNAVSTTAALSVGRDLRVANRAAGLTDLQGRLSVGGDLVVVNGDGNSRTQVAALAFEAPNAVRGDLRIVNGAGSHSNDVADTHVGGDVVFDSRGGAGDFTFNTFSAPNGPERARVRGDVTVRVRGGGGTNSLSDAAVGDDLVFVADRPGGFAHSASAALVRGDLVVRSAGPMVATVSDASILGRLDLAAGGGDDRIAVENTDVRLAARIDTGGGADEVDLDDTLFHGPVRLDTGHGNDAVRIEAGTGPSHADPAEFRGAVEVRLGGGGDTLQHGSAGDPARRVALLRQARFDGGPGTDVVDPANVGTPFGRPRYEHFERVVPPPPLMPAGLHAVGDYVLDVVTADFDGDGSPDLATANGDSETVSVLLNNGDGTFRDADTYAAGPVPSGLAVADFDGDGTPDLAVANNTGPGGTVSVLLNNGDGTFGPRTAFSAGETLAVAAVAAGDFDGDGDADVVTANRDGNNEASVSVLLNAGGGTLGAATTYQLGQINWGNGVAVGDLNGDGKLDVVASALRGLGVLLGNGDGTFQTPAVEDRGVLSGVTLADLNADGKLDLVSEANGMDVQLGNGDGTFGPAVRLLDEGTSGVAVGDFNGDGTLDLAVTHFAVPEDAGKVFLGNGDGTFGEPLAFPPGPDGGPLVAADFDGDGWLDLAAGNQEASSVTVLRNRRTW